MLTKSLKIYDTTKIEFLEQILFQRDQKIWQKYCREELSNISDHLAFWLSISALTLVFLGI